jgi:hypothetical protein
MSLDGTASDPQTRIRKLFALAGSPNEHEAALALRRRTRCLLRYNLGAEAVVSEDDHVDDVTPHARGQDQAEA